MALKRRVSEPNRMRRSVVAGANDVACTPFPSLISPLPSDLAQWIVNFSSSLEKVSALLMAAGRSAPRYENMASLYPRSKNLQSYLSEYFIVVVRFCHQLVKFTKKHTLGRLVSFPSDFDMRNYQSELDQWSSAIREEVALLMGQTIKEQSSNLRALPEAL